MKRTILAILSSLMLACGGEAETPPAETPPTAATPPAEPAVAPALAAAAPEPLPPEERLPPADDAAIAQARETGTLARSIRRDPDHAEALLAAASLTVESFEARVYDISGHPALARAYRDALEAP